MMYKSHNILQSILGGCRTFFAGDGLAILNFCTFLVTIFCASEAVPSPQDSRGQKAQLPIS